MVNDLKPLTAFALKLEHLTRNLSTDGLSPESVAPKAVCSTLRLSISSETGKSMRPFTRIAANLFWLNGSLGLARPT